MLSADGSGGSPSPSVEVWYGERFGERGGIEWPEKPITHNIHKAVSSLEGPNLNHQSTKRDLLASRLTHEVSRIPSFDDFALDDAIQKYSATLAEIIICAGDAAHATSSKETPAAGLRVGHAALLAGVLILEREAKARVEAIDGEFLFWRKYRSKDMGVKSRVRHALKRWAFELPTPGDILLKPYMPDDRLVDPGPRSLLNYAHECGTKFGEAVHDVVSANTENGVIVEAHDVIRDAVNAVIDDQIAQEGHAVSGAIKALEKKGL